MTKVGSLDDDEKKRRGGESDKGREVGRLEGDPALDGDWQWLLLLSCCSALQAEPSVLELTMTSDVPESAGAIGWGLDRVASSPNHPTALLV